MDDIKPHFDPKNEFACLSFDQISDQLWDDFVDGCDEAWLHHRYKLQQAISTWPGKQNISFAVVSPLKPDQILAAVPCQLIRAKIGCMFNWNAIESMGAPALRANLDEGTRRRLLNHVVDWLSNLATLNDVYEIRFSVDNLAPANRGDQIRLLNPLLELGCDNVVSQTWMIDLREGETAIWKRMEKRARNAIRKAEKMGVSVREAKIGRDLDIYYDLHCRTYRRTGVRPHPKAYFEAIWQDFLSQGKAKVFFAEYNEQIVAAENFGVYKNGANYWTGAASKEGLAVQANSLIQWTAIRWMLENGIEWYETGEGFPFAREGKRKGLNDFKKSFGGKLLPFYRGRIITKKRFYRVYELLKSFKV